MKKWIVFLSRWKKCPKKKKQKKKKKKKKQAPTPSQKIECFEWSAPYLSLYLNKSILLFTTYWCV